MTEGPEALPATEERDERTDRIDGLDALDCVRLLIEGQRAAVEAALAADAAVARTVELVVAALRAGRRYLMLGAGTSGRLAVLDAAELLPTFGLEPGRVEGRIAGGEPALRRAVEGAEDDRAAGAAAVADVDAEDVVLGVSASGSAPFVLAALAAARARGAQTVALVNAPASPLARAADVAIEVFTGAEPIAGSTRLRAGTAQKIVLNAISTAAMIALGKTYRNRMVDVVATNAKLRARAERLVRELVGDEVDATAFLDAAGGRVKLAVVMARRALGAGEAQRVLDAAGGRLAAVIDEPPS